MIPWRRDLGPYLDEGVLFNDERQALALMAQLAPRVREWGPCAAFGLVRRGAMQGAVVFSNWYPHCGDIELSAAFSDPHWWSPRTLRRVFAIPFADLGCNRITINTGKRNKKARAFAEKAGFTLEGVRRQAWDGRQDLVTYGLLARKCRFLKG